MSQFMAGLAQGYESLPIVESCDARVRPQEAIVARIEQQL